MPLQTLKPTGNLITGGNGSVSFFWVSFLWLSGIDFRLCLYAGLRACEIMGSHDMSCVKEQNVAQLCEVKDNTFNVPCKGIWYDNDYNWSCTGCAKERDVYIRLNQPPRWDCRKRHPRGNPAATLSRSLAETLMDKTLDHKPIVLYNIKCFDKVPRHLEVASPQQSLQW